MLKRLALCLLSGLLCAGFGFPVVLADQEAGKNLRLAWEFATPRELPLAMVVDTLGRPYLHVAMKNGGLLILSMADPARPTPAAKIAVDSLANLHVMHLTQRGNYLYLALGDFFAARAGSPAGLAVVHVGNPSEPEVVAVWKSKETLRGGSVVVVDGDYAFLGAMSEGLIIFDISNPKTIERISAVQPDVHFPLKNPSKIRHPNVRGLAIVGNLLYVAYDAGGLRILDVADKKKPRQIGRYVNAAMGKKPQAYNDVALDGKRAYLPCDYAGLEIVDVSNPRDIRPIGWWNPWDAHTVKNTWFNSPGHTNQIYLDPAARLAYLSTGASQLQVVDVANPRRPRLATTYGDPNAKLGVWGLAASDQRIYLSYIKSFVPFRGTWAGIKAIQR